MPRGRERSLSKAARSDARASPPLSLLHLQSAFMPTNSKKQLEEHVESKHPKSTFEICFPDYKA